MMRKHCKSATKRANVNNKRIGKIFGGADDCT